MGTLQEKPVKGTSCFVGVGTVFCSLETNEASVTDMLPRDPRYQHGYLIAVCLPHTAVLNVQENQESGQTISVR